MELAPCGFESHLAHLFMLKINRKNLIISADDFGKSELANRNILKLVKAGKLDRVSVMADGNFNQKEVEDILNTGVKLDVHLHLYNRLEDMEKIKESFIKRVIIFLSNYLLGIFNKKKVEEEWGQQIREFTKITGKIPDGINAHRYDHLFPIYFPIALKLAKKNDIRRIRFGKILPASKNRLVSSILKYFWRRNKRRFADSGLESFDYLVNLDWIKDPERFFGNQTEERIELVVHPERDDEYNFVSSLVK